VTPVRSCMGCGRRDPQSALIRATWRADALVRDDGRRAAGRGGYLHDDASCWQAFVGRRGPVRSLRAPVPRPARETFVRQLQAGAWRREA
jgi:predicted RNA-binding protein YlxR (DUF448 family)